MASLDYISNTHKITLSLIVSAKSKAKIILGMTFILLWKYVFLYLRSMYPLIIINILYIYVQHGRLSTYVSA